MISPNSIKEYLGRENLRDSALVKVKDEAHLDSRLAELTNNFKFTTNLRKHQKAGVLLTLRRKAYMLLFDMGLGKTATSLACIEYLKSVGIVTRSIVLVPNISNLFSWENEIKKHTPSLTYASLFGDRAERQEILDGNSDILIATYAGFNSFVTKKVKVKKKNQLVIDKDLATKYSNYFQMVIWDEIPAAKNIHSLIFKAAKWLSAACEYRIGLTGTPFGKDPQDLWAQFYLIDNGETLGETLGLFRAGFFIEKTDWFAGTIYEFNPKQEELLNRTLRHSSLRYKTEECLDLPEKIYTVAPYQLTKEQKDYYRAEIDKIKAAVDNPFELGGSYHRLKTICSGWIGAKDDDGERVDIIFDENPKLDAIMDWLDSLDPNEKVLLFNHYIGTGDIYEAALKERKIGFARLYSKTRDREGVQDRFINDKKCRVFLSSSSGAKGLNLQCARYCTFIESPSTPDQRDQMEKRVHRMGQDRTVFITDFVARRSLEEKNLKSLAEGVDLFTAIIEGKVDLDLDI